jgi:hypothetical protein
MTDPRSDDLQRSREEAALLLRLDPQNLSPSDALRCDLIATLRLSIDSAQADALDGRAADLGRLIVATESLVKLLPSEPPKAASSHVDPRQRMWETYSAMRERGEAFERTQVVPGLQARIAELEAEIAQLKGEGPPEPSPQGRLPENVRTLSPKGAPAASTEPAQPKPRPSPSVVVIEPRDEPWRAYVEPDGSIRSTPRGPWSI